MTQQNQPPALKKGWVVFFAILFTIVLIPTILAFSLDRTFFSEDFTKSVFDEQKVYDQVPALLAVATSQNSGASTNSSLSFFSFFSQKQLTDFYLTVLPADYTRSQTSQMLDSLFNFINLKSNTLELKVDLTPIKNNLQGTAGTEAINQLFNSLPDCTQDQILAEMQKVLQTGSLDISALLTCKPPQQYLSIISTVADKFLQQTATVLPEQVIIADSQNSAVTQQLTSSKAFQDFVIFRKALIIIPWAALILLVLLALLSIRSPRLFFSSLGIPLLVSGVVSVFLFLIVKMGGQTVLINYFPASSGSGLNALLFSLTQAAMNHFVFLGLWVSGIVSAAGLILTLIGARIKA